MRDKELLYAPLEPYFWKPINDNQDKNGYYKEKMTMWDDMSVHGVGGADTWGKPTLEQYTIFGIKPHSYSFTHSAE